MTPIELTGLYDILRNRIAAHDLPACTEISLRLSSSFRDEIAFYRLVFWAYALVNEAARIPFDFLTNLPPLRADTSLRTEISQLRTFLAHNLDRRNRRDQRTMAFVQRWFMEACGHGEPNDDIHYGDCCVHLADKLQEALGGAIEACGLLDDPDDGLRLVASLRDRIDIAWPGHRFDRIVSACASRLGNPDVDLLMVRSRHLDSWRRFLARAPRSVASRRSNSALKPIFSWPLVTPCLVVCGRTYSGSRQTLRRPPRRCLFFEKPDRLVRCRYARLWISSVLRRRDTERRSATAGAGSPPRASQAHEHYSADVEWHL